MWLVSFNIDIDDLCGVCTAVSILLSKFISKIKHMGLAELWSRYRCGPRDAV